MSSDRGGNKTKEKNSKKTFEQEKDAQADKSIKKARNQDQDAPTPRR